MTDFQRDKIHRERKKYQEKQGNKNYVGNKHSIEKIQRDIDHLKSSMSSISGGIPPGTRSHRI